MNEVNVMVVPETEDFANSVSHESLVWINANLGTPKLNERNVKYLAPYWITEKLRGVNRVYHITNHSLCADGTTEIELGNSFVLPRNELWDNMGNFRRFEYHALSSFGLMEIREGLLFSIPQNQ